MISGLSLLPACAVRHPVCIRPSCTSWSISTSLTAILICITALATAKGQGFDPRTANQQLLRQLQEDSARQRARARTREDAEDAAEAERKLPPDFSQFSTPAEPLPRIVTPPPISAARSLPTGVSGKVSCSLRSVGITIDINGEIDNSTVESVSKLFDQYHEQQRKWHLVSSAEIPPHNKVHSILAHNQSISE